MKISLREKEGIPSREGRIKNEAAPQKRSGRKEKTQLVRMKVCPLKEDTPEGSTAKKLEAVENPRKGGGGTTGGPGRRPERDGSIC